MKKLPDEEVMNSGFKKDVERGQFTYSYTSMPKRRLTHSKQTIAKHDPEEESKS